MAGKKKSHGTTEDAAAKAFWEAYNALCVHPLFAPLTRYTHVKREKNNSCPRDGWAVVSGNGWIQPHPTRLAPKEEWMYVLAHCVLHLAFRHTAGRIQEKEWTAACDVFIFQFLRDLRFGTPPPEFRTPLEISGQSEGALYERFKNSGIPKGCDGLSMAGPFVCDMLPGSASTWGRDVDWEKCFAKGLAQATASAVNVAAGLEPYLGAEESHHLQSAAQKARRWMISSYPLLGSMAIAFELIEDPQVCARLDVRIAAVNAELKEVYVNPAGIVDEMDCRFILAHEFLHVGLRHQMRRQGRDPYLWNVACDFVINDWLIEMGVGQVPSGGLLYDPQLKGLSAEAVYDRIVTDMRKFRKLATLRGNCDCGDMIDDRDEKWWRSKDATSLDDFYRQCLAEGLAYHQASGRGLLPASLVEEIRALTQPPIPWDVELAQWFDSFFPPREKHRSYARPSRRQASTPDIPRPRYVPAEMDSARTFGVVLDTSGSMDRELLGKALGAIASYSIAREVPYVRVVHCDAMAYDQGYMAPEAIADRVQIRGRGGTVLQPGIDMLESAKDFPEKGPILIITDGFCDRFKCKREHAVLLPEGHYLPVSDVGKVFRLK